MTKYTPISNHYEAIMVDETIELKQISDPVIVYPDSLYYKYKYFDSHEIFTINERVYMCFPNLFIYDANNKTFHQLLRFEYEVYVIDYFNGNKNLAYIKEPIQDKQLIHSLKRMKYGDYNNIYTIRIPKTVNIPGNDLITIYDNKNNVYYLMRYSENERKLYIDLNYELVFSRPRLYKEVESSSDYYDYVDGVDDYSEDDAVNEPRAGISYDVIIDDNNEFLINDKPASDKLLKRFIKIYSSERGRGKIEYLISVFSCPDAFIKTMKSLLNTSSNILNEIINRIMTSNQETLKRELFKVLKKLNERDDYKMKTQEYVDLLDEYFKRI